MSEIKRKVIHMAGIVPISSPPLDFKMPWHDCLMPIGQDYLAVERAVYECALAGCETIWVVGYHGMQPLIRKVIGDYIADPVSQTSGLNASMDQRDISIYYVPIRPKDKGVRDSLGWSILYGADIAYRTSSVLSKWMIPRKFYCAFPYGIMPEDEIWINRKKIGRAGETVFSYNGKTVKDNLHISFTMNEDQYKACRNALYISKRDLNVLDSKFLTKHYSLEQVFSPLTFNKEDVIEIPWFHDISSWDKYTNFLSTKECKNLVKNRQAFLTTKRRLFPSKEEKKQFRTINEQNIKPDPKSFNGVDIL